MKNHETFELHSSSLQRYIADTIYRTQTHLGPFNIQKILNNTFPNSKPHNMKLTKLVTELNENDLTITAINQN